MLAQRSLVGVRVAATDLRYEVSVADLASGDASLSYAHHGGGVIAGTNGYSTGSGVIADTMAMPCRGSSAAARSAVRDVSKRIPFADVPHPARVFGGSVPAAAATATDHGCLPDTFRSCLNNWRFGVAPSYVNDSGHQSAWQVAIDGLGDSGSLLYFFDSTNPELLIKVVDGCAINGHWWVFGSAATDLEYWVTVSDWATASQEQNPDGTYEPVSFGRQNSYFHRGGGRIDGRAATRLGRA